MEERISITATSDGATASEVRWFMKERVSSLARFRTDGMRLTGNSELLRISWVQAYATKESQAQGHRAPQWGGVRRNGNLHRLLYQNT